MSKYYHARTYNMFLLWFRLLINLYVHKTYSKRTLNKVIIIKRKYNINK